MPFWPSVFASLSVPGCRQAPVACLRPGAGAEPHRSGSDARAGVARGRPAGLLRLPCLWSRPLETWFVQVASNLKAKARNPAGHGTPDPHPMSPRSPIPDPRSPICRGSGVGVPPPICRGSGVHPHPWAAIPDLPESGTKLPVTRSAIASEYCMGLEFRLPQCLTLMVNCHQSSLIFEGRQCPMTPLTTAAAATRVIRSHPGSHRQLERNRAFWRMISASVMQLSDAPPHHHRRNRPPSRSASVTRSHATARLS